MLMMACKVKFKLLRKITAMHKSTLELNKISNILNDSLQNADDERSKDVPWPFKIEAAVGDATTQQQQLQQQLPHTQYFGATTDAERQVFIDDSPYRKHIYVVSCVLLSKRLLVSATFAVT